MSYKLKANRRQFFKILGISALSGAGSVSSIFALTRHSTLDTQHSAKRWAMVVDMSKFKTEEDYKRCIDACHRVHNVPDFENTKDEIKWIWTAPYKNVFHEQGHEYESDIKNKPFVVLCNHCDNPPCVRVCPTKATFKRQDGIVAMDYHRCIGCRFCMAACPYGSRSFNWRNPQPFIKEKNIEYPTRTKGVVEKCNFCEERLAEGLPPACVEACKNINALVFGDLNDPDSEVRKILSSRYTIRRKPELGTQPSVYYILD
jgi:molybdopterin-containing oxidoreductase family iron-sulfur binding subunit